MASYTLLELIDYSLRYPDVGAVNFNALHLVLKIIINKCGLQEERVYCSQPGFVPIMNQELTNDQEQDAYSEDKEDRISSKKSNTDESRSDKQDEIDVTVNSGHIETERVLYEMRNKIDLLENELIEIKDDLVEINQVVESKTFRRIKYDEGQKRERNYEDFDLNREEFESALEDLGEAICRVSFQLKNQTENEDKILRENATLRDICGAIVDEKLSKYQDSVNDTLKELALAVRKLQRLFKEVIYPEAAGVTKCLNCGRKAQISVKDLIHSSNHFTNSRKDLPRKREKYVMKHEKKSDPLKFTVLALKKLHLEDGEKKLATSKNVANWELKEPPSLDARTQESLSSVDKRILEPIYDKKDLISTFIPLRMNEKLSKIKSQVLLQPSDKTTKGTQFENLKRQDVKLEKEIYRFHK